jgi:hypothetical protein
LSQTEESSEHAKVLTRVLSESTENITRLIKEIQTVTKRKLIVYVANFNHPLGGIHLTDIMPFEEILRTADPSDEIDLLLNSPGGEINAAEKIVAMLRARYTHLRVVVPNQAKSAATLIALASDQVVMGYLSELGPIDSQIVMMNPDGSPGQTVPAQSVIDSIQLIKDKLKEAKTRGEPTEPYIVMSSRIDPVIWDLAIKAQSLSAQFAEKWLSRFMCKGNPQLAKEIAAKFMDVKRFLSHGRMIGPGDAKDLLPSVMELARDSELWNKSWELYVRCEWFLNANQTAKLYANERTVINLGATVSMPPGRGVKPPQSASQTEQRDVKPKEEKSP